MAKVYISLGTNLGDKEQNLRTAVQKIEEQVGKVISLSAFYITAPWGFDSEHSFLNAAACVETELSPLEVLQKTQEIERELGRTHKSVGGVYSDRLIDIDLLLYDDLILSVTSPSGAALNLPHPLMAERDAPLNGDCPRTGASGIGKDNEGAAGADRKIIQHSLPLAYPFTFYFSFRR